MGREFTLNAVEFAPTLSDEFQARFDSLTDELVEYTGEVNREVTLKEEIQEIETTLDPADKETALENPSASPDDVVTKVRYLACLEVLLDLLEMGYELQKNNHLKVLQPNPTEFSDQPKKFKKVEKDRLEKERREQFKDDSVYRFIKEMEGGHSYSGRHTSIRDLISDGKTLFEDLSTIAELDERDAITRRLPEVLDPYIQVVTKGKKDEHTGLDLMDIWRYFRYTWLTPYNTVPGRNINFLVRNRAQENDPVMGIASLASSMMNLGVRDEEIGWTMDGLKNRLQRKSRTLTIEEQLPKEERTPEQKTREVTREEFLETEEEYEERKTELCQQIRKSLEEELERSIQNIRIDDFVAEYEELDTEDIWNATETTFSVLERIEEDARQKIDDPTINEPDPEQFDSWERRSETPLFRKKRAENLQTLLENYRYFQKNSDLGDIEFIESSVEDSEGKTVLGSTLREIKKQRAGTGMMNIMVCGAIPPYNPILTGKLVAMAVTGPKVIEAYEEKYDGQVSEIASSMKGEPVVKQNRLAALDTTGLFEVGSAQYDRVRIPASSGQIEFEELGLTQGFGSLQFGKETMQRLSEVTKFEKGKQKVTGTFGEGVAPRMRKIRGGLEDLGLDGDLLKHNSRRKVYFVELADNSKEYLRGEADEIEYYWNFDDIEAEQKSIYDHWLHRWVSKRIQKPDKLAKLKDYSPVDSLLLSRDIDSAQKQLSDFIVE